MVQGLTEPELFYMPFGKKVAKETRIYISLFNTFDINTMEYSHNTKLSSCPVSSHIIITNQHGNIIFNSKKQHSKYRDNYNPNHYFVLENLPYGTYKVKVIYTDGTGIVDNTFYEFIVENEYVFYTIYLKFRWVTQTLYMDEGDIQTYIGGSEKNFTVNSVNLGAYWSHIEVTDDKSGELICRTPIPHYFLNEMIRRSYTNIYGYTTHGIIYTDKICDNYTVSCDLKYESRVWVGAETVMNTNNVVHEEISSAVVDTVFCKLKDEKQTAYLKNLYNSYETYTPTYISSTGKIRYLTDNGKISVYNRYNGILVTETIIQEDGYTNATYNSINDYCKDSFCYEVYAALQSYKNKDSINEINKEFFYYNHLIVTQNRNYRTYSTINSISDYVDFLESQEKDPTSKIVKKVSNFDYEKIYINSKIDLDYFISKYNANIFSGSHNLEIIISSEVGQVVVNSDYCIQGYMIFSEESGQKSIRHIICTGIPSYSDDYDQY